MTRADTRHTRCGCGRHGFGLAWYGGGRARCAGGRARVRWFVWVVMMVMMRMGIARRASAPAREFGS